MLKYTCLVFLVCFNLAIAFDKSITLSDYSQCKAETIVEAGQGHSISSYWKFQKYVHLDTLHYGRHAGEIKIKFYFQGTSHFGVALLPDAREPHHNDFVLNTEISTKSTIGNSYSAIFLNTAQTKICDTVNFANPMNGIYFTEVELVINTEYGFVAVFLPNYGTTPFMKCYEPEAISRVKYIAITGAHEKTARYIYDCPI